MTLNEQLRKPLSQTIIEKVEGILGKIDEEEQAVMLHILAKLSRENLRI